MNRRIVTRSLLLIVTSLCAYGQTYQATFDNARALLKAKRFNEALQEAERASRLDNTEWGAYFVAGTALVGLERQAEAISQFQAALARAPEKAKPIINEAIAACRQILANRSQPPATYSPPPPLGAISPVPSHVVSPPAAPQASAFGSVGNCWELHTFGSYTANPGTVSLGSTFGWEDPQDPSHNYSVPVDQVRDFKVELWYQSKQQQRELKEQRRIDVSQSQYPEAGGGANGVRITFSINGKRKGLGCYRNEFVTIFQYFQSHGFYQGFVVNIQP
jgi:tetratricopeptide (TPR) repeat protein